MNIESYKKDQNHQENVSTETFGEDSDDDSSDDDNTDFGSDDDLEDEAGSGCESGCGDDTLDEKHGGDCQCSNCSVSIQSDNGCIISPLF